MEKLTDSQYCYLLNNTQQLHQALNGAIFARQRMDKSKTVSELEKLRSACDALIAKLSASE